MIYGVPVSLTGHLSIFLSIVIALVGSIDASAIGLKVQHGSLAGKGLAVISTPNGDNIFAEIADTPAKRAEGLMGRTNLAPDHGMLFTFSEPGHWTFWMKNTKMSLDILWLDTGGKVVHLESNVPICTRTDEGCPRYHPSKKALYVLELRAGMAERLGIHKGTVLEIALP
jgi:uncharacterized membrane protein (UPF0127 family)